eukprot:1642036-Rhodomonas_salina.2
MTPQRSQYALSGTDVASAATRKPYAWRPVQYQPRLYLPIHWATTGTDLGCIILCTRIFTFNTDLVCRLGILRTPYAMTGTKLGCTATRHTHSLRHGRY